MFTRSGRLAATHLGRAVLRDAAVVAGAVLPKATWIALVASVAVLGALGTVLSLQVGGRRLVWTLGLVLAGIAVTIIGVQVDLV
jgi:hypothetical protein